MKKKSLEVGNEGHLILFLPVAREQLRSSFFQGRGRTAQGYRYLSLRSALLLLKDRSHRRHVSIHPLRLMFMVSMPFPKSEPGGDGSSGVAAILVWVSLQMGNSLD